MEVTRGVGVEEGLSVKAAYNLAPTIVFNKSA